jgi:dTDP-4-dehydrorhamnose reductase
LCVSDLGAIHRALRDFTSNPIINTSAYTDVDSAETHVEIANGIKAAFIHYSTDYVLDGKNSQPHTERDPTSPLNVYGRTIRMGEKQIQDVGGAYLIPRASRVYSLPGKSFENKVLGCSRKNTAIKIVSAPLSNPTRARALAYTTSSVSVENRNGLSEKFRENRGRYHVEGSGHTSRYKGTQEILTNEPWRTEPLFQTIEPVSSDEFPLPGTRPSFSALDCSRLEATFHLKLPDQKQSLRRPGRNN